MNRITPKKVKDIYRTLSLFPERYVFYSDGSACVLGALYANKFGKDDAEHIDTLLVEENTSYRDLADVLDLDRDYVEGIIAGWDGAIVKGAFFLSLEDFEAGYEDGVAAYSAAHGW